MDYRVNSIAAINQEKKEFLGMGTVSHFTLHFTKLRRQMIIFYRSAAEAGINVAQSNLFLFHNI